MRVSICLGIVIVLFGPAAAAQVQTQDLPPPSQQRAPQAPAPAPPLPQGAWIADTATRCRVWNPTPEGEEAIRWEGACPGGTAQGLGVLQWFRDGQPTDRYEGEVKNLSLIHI